MGEGEGEEWVSLRVKCGQCEGEGKGVWGVRLISANTVLVVSAG